jgi:hypothetical protein
VTSGPLKSLRFDDTPQVSFWSLNIARMSNWNGREWTGVVLLVLSFIMFWSILAVPWLDASVSTRAWIAGSLAVGAEVLFWIGILVSGRDFMHRYRKYLSPRKILGWVKDVNDNPEEPPKPIVVQPPESEQK